METQNASISFTFFMWNLSIRPFPCSQWFSDGHVCGLGVCWIIGGGGGGDTGRKPCWNMITSPSKQGSRRKWIFSPQGINTLIILHVSRITPNCLRQDLQCWTLVDLTEVWTCIYRQVVFYVQLAFVAISPLIFEWSTWAVDQNDGNIIHILDDLCCSCRLTRRYFVFCVKQSPDWSQTHLQSPTLF